MKKLELFDLLELPAIKRAYDRTLWLSFPDSFTEYLSTSFDEYGDALTKINQSSLPRDVDIEIIKKSSDIFKKGIVETVRLYHEGQPGLAFKEFESTMNSIQDYFPDLDFILEKSILKKPSDHLHLFRMRECTNPFEMDSRTSIFHVPFDKRHLITVARYSIPGFPSLYLGRSLYACWEEMKRPSFDNLYFSRFNFANTARILFLAHDPHDMLSEEQIRRFCEDTEFRQNLYSFLAFWPLQLACSIPTLNGNASFYPEYIIPQMLMQWIRNTESSVDGICYRTTRVPLTHKVKQDVIYKDKYPSPFPQILNNYVIPVKCNNTKGHCPKLAKMLSCTSPISWNLADIVERSPHRPCRDENRSPVHESRIARLKITLNDIEMYYDGSVFGKRENTSLSDSFSFSLKTIDGN